MSAFVRLQEFLTPLALDLLRLCVWLTLLLVLFVPLERWFAIRPQSVFRRAFRVDLIYYFLSGLLPKLMLVAPLTLVAAGLHHVLPTAFYPWVAALPLWLRLTAAMVVGEVGFYWGHRWSHEWPVLWRFHAIHHSPEELDWLVNSRAHPVDMLFTRLCGLVPLYVLGLAQPVGNTLDFTPVGVTVAGTLWGFFIHANIRWRLGWMEWLVSSPAFHHWHHTNDGPDVVNKNFASTLPCLDWCFGTLYLPRQWPGKYGSDTWVDAGLTQQLLEPLRPPKA